MVDFICNYCLHGCSTQDILDRHMGRCRLHGAQRVKLPQKGDVYDKVMFTKTEYQLRLPFVMYADFESILKKHDVCRNDPAKSWTLKYQSHEACGLYMVCSDKRFYRAPEVYHGADSAEKFLDRVLSEAAELREIRKKKIPMIRLTPKEWREHHHTRMCHICKKDIKSDERKVRYHDHLTGEYRGAAHSSCNLQYRINPEKVKIPCIIHNLKGYDVHLILSAIKPHHGEVKRIPNNMETYTSFTIGGVTFIDSCQFMQSSLDQLVSNWDGFSESEKYLQSQYVIEEEIVDLNENMEIDEDITDEDNIEQEEQSEEVHHYRRRPYKEPVLDEEQAQFVTEQLNMMTRKGVYPYEYMDSWSRFDESELPSQKYFDSMLTGQSISDADYEHAKKVFADFEMQDMRDYHNFYLLDRRFIASRCYLNRFEIPAYQITIWILLIIILLQDYLGKLH